MIECLSVISKQDRSATKVCGMRLHIYLAVTICFRFFPTYKSGTTTIQKVFYVIFLFIDTIDFK